MNDSHLVAPLGLAIRQLREEHGWSQEALAEHANLNRSYVGELERGHALASVLTLEKLARAFGLSPACLLAHAERLVHADDSQEPPLMAPAC